MDACRVWSGKVYLGVNGGREEKAGWPLKTGYGENVVTACSCVCWWGRYRALSHRQLQNGVMDVK